MVAGNSLNDHVLTAAWRRRRRPAPAASSSRWPGPSGHSQDPCDPAARGRGAGPAGAGEPDHQPDQRPASAGRMPPPAAAIVKLLSSLSQYRIKEIAAGDRRHRGRDERQRRSGRHVRPRWLGARIGTIAGGSNEMQRNAISERVLGLPREPTPDKGVPFSQVLAQPPPAAEPDGDESMWPPAPITAPCSSTASGARRRRGVPSSRETRPRRGHRPGQRRRADDATEAIAAASAAARAWAREDRLRAGRGPARGPPADDRSARRTSPG